MRYGADESRAAEARAAAEAAKRKAASGEHGTTYVLKPRDGKLTRRTRRRGP